MIKTIEVVVPANKIQDSAFLQKQIVIHLCITERELTSYTVNRRSIDARGKSPIFRLSVTVYINEKQEVEKSLSPNYQEVKPNKMVLIIGCGPAGMFAALRLLEYGIKPIILERGKDVRLRRHDLRNIQQFNLVNPDSNYCFGEGGAGTYSDGKLYTRSNKRGNIKKILAILVDHGASSDILIDAHPHIGSNKLPKVVASMRNKILEFGGEIYFNTRVTDFILNRNELRGVLTQNNQEFIADAVILATGHSARDIYELLDKRKIKIEAKPFALGVRIEHPQELIDEIQYKCKIRPNELPASSYSLVEQVGGKGVYSFCMCPGGIIVPAATSPGELVVNGMSMSRRDSKFANSGMVTTIEETDWLPFKNHGELAGLFFQKHIEQQAFLAANSTQKAPAQRLLDFINKKESSSLPPTSYIPGLTHFSVWEVLPNHIAERLKNGLSAFGKKQKNYLTNEAIVVATESRTSSPVKIPRDPVTLQHVQIQKLFPCGEGAGYAGGIISAAMDGERCADAAAIYVFKMNPFV